MSNPGQERRTLIGRLRKVMLQRGNASGSLLALVTELNSLSDRACAIAAAADVEDKLQWFLTARLLIPDFEEHRLFYDQGELATFHAKIKHGFSQNLFGQDTYNDLMTIKEIRNAFAHSVFVNSFHQSEVSDVASLLHAPKHWNDTAYNRAEARMWFQLACMFYSAELWNQRESPSLVLILS